MTGARMGVITQAVVERYAITLDQMFCQRRKRSLSRPRQAAMALCRQLTGHSLPEIARFFSKHHTTVVHACCAVRRREQTDPAFAEEMRQLRLRLGNALEFHDLDSLTMRVYAAQAEQAKWEDPGFSAEIPEALPGRREVRPATLIAPTIARAPLAVAVSKPAARPEPIRQPFRMWTVEELEARRLKEFNRVGRP